MTLPFTLPDWVPPWLTFAVLVPALLYLLAFLFMPFSVIGVKTRLENLEARLDEIQGEIRSLVLRLPEPLRGQYDETALNYLQSPRPRQEADHNAYVRPPIPPAPQEPDYKPSPAFDEFSSRTPRQASRPRDGATRFSRNEPRFDAE